MTTPARQLEQLLAPHRVLHHQWWCWLLASAGAEGWRRVAVQVYHFMKLANQLLHTARQESARRGDTQASFEDWARVHADEEAAHPAWLLEDLVAAGCHRGDILANPPEEELRELASAQLALIQDGHPTAVLGLYFATECYPPEAVALRRVARRLGLPREALRTLLHHSRVDPSHGKVIRQLVDVHGQHPAQLRGMAHGALHCINSWIHLFQRCSAEAMAGNRARVDGHARPLHARAPRSARHPPR